MASEELQLNVLAELEAKGDASKLGNLEHLEDRHIAQQLISQILSNGVISHDSASTVGDAGLPVASVDPSSVLSSCLPVSYSNVDIGALINLIPNNVMAVTMAPTSSNLLSKKPSQAQPNTSTSTKSSVMLSIPSSISEGAAKSKGQVLVPGAQQGGVLQTTPIMLNSQTSLIRTPNGQTAILLNPPVAVSGAPTTSSVQMSSSVSLGPLASLPIHSAPGLAASQIQTSLPHAIPFPLSASSLKLPSGFLQQIIQLPKTVSDSPPAERKVEVNPEEGERKEDQQVAKALMDMLRDETHIHNISTASLVPPSTSQSAGHLVGAAKVVSSTSLTQNVMSNLVFTTTSPTPAVLPVAVQSVQTESKSQPSPTGGNRSLNVSRKRPLEVDESIDSDMEDFVKQFKDHRLKLGYTQLDVGRELRGKGQGLSQTTVCRFESMMLSPQNMKKIMILLQEWMREATPKFTDTDATSTRKNRKRRTTLTPANKQSLEKEFVNHPKPGSQELTNIAESLSLDYEVVRVWFCNRRQKDRRETTATSSDMDPLKLEDQEDNEGMAAN